MSLFGPQLMKNSVQRSVTFLYEISLEKSPTHNNAVLLNETTANQGTSRQTKKGAKLSLRTPNEYSRTGSGACWNTTLSKFINSCVSSSDDESH
jgi:hypothetical protein